MPNITITNRLGAILSIQHIGKIAPRGTVTKNLEESCINDILPTLERLSKNSYIQYSIQQASSENVVSTIPPVDGNKIKNLYVDDTGKIIIEFEKL
jgi:hypothetical protein